MNIMENETEEIKVSSSHDSYINLLSKHRFEINKYFSLQIIYIILIMYLLLQNSIHEKHYKDMNQKYLNNFANIYKNNNISLKIRLLKLMTNNNVLEYKGIQECLINDPDSLLCIYHLISTKGVLNKERILIGYKRDGSYVLLNDFLNIKIAYSFGIGRAIQFDKELADRGIDIYMYDHTINSLPFEHQKFHWKKIGVSGSKLKNKFLKSIDELIIENGHINEENMILKMDIESKEWDVLFDLKEDILKKFKYILLELHFQDETKFNNHNIYYNVLKKIHKSHQAFYIRCNDNTRTKVNFGHNRICPLIEVSYIIRKDNIFIKDNSIYPIYEFEFQKPPLNKLETNLNILKLFDD